MKIAILCTPKDLHARKWAMALSRAGAEVIFCCPAPDWEEIPGVRVIPVSGRKPDVWSYTDFWFSAPRLRKILLREKPDIVNALHVTPFGVWARLTHYKPLVLMALGADILEYAYSVPNQFRWKAGAGTSVFRNFISRKWHAWQVIQSLKSAQKIYADNQSIMDGIHLICASVKTKTDLFTWGIPMEKFYPPAPEQKKSLRQKYALPEEKIIILAPRGLKPLYRPDLILQAIHISEKEYSDTYHWLILKGPYEIPDSILPQMSQLNPEYVTFIPDFLPEDALAEIWQLSDLLVSMPVYDGLSASVIQGISTGLLPVLGNIPASRDLLNLGIQFYPVLKDQPDELWRNIVLWFTRFSGEERAQIRKSNADKMNRYADIEQNTRTFLREMEKISNIP